jgi:hypothetical protein
MHTELIDKREATNEEREREEEEVVHDAAENK